MTRRSDETQLDFFDRLVEPAPTPAREPSPKREPRGPAQVLPFPSARRFVWVRGWAAMLADTPEAERAEAWRKHLAACRRDWARLGVVGEAADADLADYTRAVHVLVPYFEAEIARHERGGVR